MGKQQEMETRVRNPESPETVKRVRARREGQEWKTEERKRKQSRLGTTEKGRGEKTGKTHRLGPGDTSHLSYERTFLEGSCGTPVSPMIQGFSPLLCLEINWVG